jgi:hypothetical protein
VLLYVWGSRLPAHEIEACSDRLCGLRVVLSDSRAHLFAAQSEPASQPALNESSTSYLLPMQAGSFSLREKITSRSEVVPGAKPLNFVQSTKVPFCFAKRTLCKAQRFLLLYYKIIFIYFYKCFLCSLICLKFMVMHP